MLGFKVARSEDCEFCDRVLIVKHEGGDTAIAGLVCNLARRLA
jgi:hypothetical protein